MSCFQTFIPDKVENRSIKNKIGTKHISVQHSESTLPQKMASVPYSLVVFEKLIGIVHKPNNENYKILHCPNCMICLETRKETTKS